MPPPLSPLVPHLHSDAFVFLFYRHYGLSACLSFWFHLFTTLQWDDSADGFGHVTLPSVQQRGVTSPSPRKATSPIKSADPRGSHRVLALTSLSSNDASPTDKLSPTTELTSPPSKKMRWNDLVDSLILDASPQPVRKSPNAGSRTHKYCGFPFALIWKNDELLPYLAWPFGSDFACRFVLASLPWRPLPRTVD